MESERKGGGALWKACVSLVLCLGSSFLLAAGTSALLSFDGADDLTKINTPLFAAILFAGFVAASGVAAGFLSSALEHEPKAFYPHLTPLLAYGACFGFLYLLTGRWLPLEALPAVCFYLTAFVVFRMKKGGRSKTLSSLAGGAAAVALCAVTVVFHALFAVGAGGNFFTDYIETVRDRLDACAELLALHMKGMISDTEGLSGLLTVVGLLPSSVTPDEIYEYYLEYYTYYYTYIASLIPALLTSAFCVASYVCASMTVALSGKNKDRPKWMLTVSGYTLVVFILSSLIGAFLLPLLEFGVLSTLLTSVLVITMPLMFALGVRALTHLNGKFISSHKLIFIIGLILTVLNPVLMISVIGAYAEAAKKLAARFRAMQDGPGGPDPGQGFFGRFTGGDGSDQNENSDDNGQNDKNDGGRHDGGAGS